MRVNAIAVALKQLAICAVIIMPREMCAKNAAVDNIEAKIYGSCNI